MARNLKRLAIWLSFALAVNSTTTEARWKPEYASAPPAVSQWFNEQKLTPETKKEYGVTFSSCCDHADVCETCVVHRVSDSPPWRDGWYYKKDDGAWMQLPPHVVEYVDWTPTGKPVLFLYPYDGGFLKKGTPVCLKVPGGAT